MPTWNYAKVHVRGQVTEVTNLDDKYQHMLTSSDHFEQVKVLQGLTSSEKNTPWSLAAAYSNGSGNSDANENENAIKHMLQAITVFTLTISSIEGHLKFNQKKPLTLRAQLAEQVARRNKPLLAELIRFF